MNFNCILNPDTIVINNSKNTNENIFNIYQYQANSQSKRISSIIRNFILEINNKIELFQIDMFDLKVPLWTSEKENKFLEE